MSQTHILGRCIIESSHRTTAPPAWGRHETCSAQLPAARCGRIWGSMSDTLAKLRQLQLVAKVCTLLESSIGIGDKALAEFIIHMAGEHPNPADFSGALAAAGATLDDSVVGSLLRTINKSKAAAQAPGGKKAKPVAATVARDEKSAQFPGLAIPDRDPAPEVASASAGASRGAGRAS